MQNNSNNSNNNDNNNNNNNNNDNNNNIGNNKTLRCSSRAGRLVDKYTPPELSSSPASV
jgi:hypothetical protein